MCQIVENDEQRLGLDCADWKGLTTSATRVLSRSDVSRVLVRKLVRLLLEMECLVLKSSSVSKEFAEK